MLALANKAFPISNPKKISFLKNYTKVFYKKKQAAAHLACKGSVFEVVGKCRK